MNRYSSEASSPTSYSSPLSEASFNISKVRSGLTDSPQTRFSVFKLLPTSYGLEIKMPVNRVRGSLIAAVMKEKSSDSTRLTLWAVVGMALFVGGVVALTGSPIFGAVMAIVLPAVLWLITLSEKVTSQGHATLRLVNAPNGQTFLSMSTLSTYSRNKASKERVSIAQIDARKNAKRENDIEALYSPYIYSADSFLDKPKTVVYFSNRSVKLVSARTGISGGELSFTVYTESDREGNCLRVTGSCEEVRWLHARVAQWGKGLG